MGPNHKASLLLKEFADNQSFPEMIGYIMKDKGQPHFEEVRFNVSDEEVQAGIEAYGLVRNLYAEGKKEITKAGLLKVVFSFWKSNFYPLRSEFRFDHVLRLMLCSGHWMPSPMWIITGQGSGVDFQKAESLLEMATVEDCCQITIDQVHDVFLARPGALCARSRIPVIMIVFLWRKHVKFPGNCVTVCFPKMTMSKRVGTSSVTPRALGGLGKEGNEI
jgi:hypothetical protein